MKRLAVFLLLMAVPALAHEPYDRIKFAGAGASGSWETEMRSYGHSTYYASYVGHGTSCSQAQPCSYGHAAYVEAKP